MGNVIAFANGSEDWWEDDAGVGGGSWVASAAANGLPPHECSGLQVDRDYRSIHSHWDPAWEARSAGFGGGESTSLERSTLVEEDLSDSVSLVSSDASQYPAESLPDTPSGSVAQSLRAGLCGSELVHCVESEAVVVNSDDDSPLRDGAQLRGSGELAQSLSLSCSIPPTVHHLQGDERDGGRLALRSGGNTAGVPQVHGAPAAIASPTHAHSSGTSKRKQRAARRKVWQSRKSTIGTLNTGESGKLTEALRPGSSAGSSCSMDSAGSRPARRTSKYTGAVVPSANRSSSPDQAPAAPSRPEWDKRKRWTQGMISGEYLDATGSRRTSRGKGVTVFGGELVEWSSVHELAKEHQFNPGNTLYHSKAQEDLYMQLVHHSKREPLWVEWEGGRIEEFEIGSAKANSMIPALAREAMDLSAPLVKMMEKREQDRLVREYTQRWHRYVRSELNVVGIPLSIRWRTFIGRWLLRFGFTAALPPRP